MSSPILSPQNVANAIAPTVNTSKAIMNAGFGNIQIIEILMTENATMSKNIENRAVVIQCCCAALSNLTAKTKFCISGICLVVQALEWIV